MGTGPKRWTEALIAQRVKDGRGQGAGDDYSAWLYVQEFSSKGTQTRIPGINLKRTIHTFSYIERAMFLLHEFREGLLDFQEQYPMDRRITLGAAAGLGIRHPLYPITRVPVVMTLDAVVTRRLVNGQRSVAAWDAKPARMLKDRRTLEKLSLHKAYCAHVGISHFVFTELSVPKTVIRNIDWLRGSQPKEGEIETVPGLFTVHPQLMLEDLWARQPKGTIRRYCTDYNKAHGWPVGTALRLIKVLLWRHELPVDLTAKHIELECVPNPTASPVALQLRRAA